MNKKELEAEVKRLLVKLEAIKLDHLKWCPHEDCSILAILECPYNSPYHKIQHCLCYGIEGEPEFCDCEEDHEEADDSESWKGPTSEDTPEGEQ